LLIWWLWGEKVDDQIDMVDRLEVNYRIEVLPPFTVIGMEKEITKRQSLNIEICKLFWHKFNASIKKNYISPHGNWVKYAFTYMRNNEYHYCCAIPKKHCIPEGFIQIEVNEKKYMVVKHIGAMDTIYCTYNRIYRILIPQSGYTADKNQFFHFEKYDYSFNWNRDDSVIEIWVPIK
jgi:predicted transcriptional regulator YdeE